MLFKILHGDQSRISLDTTPFHEGWCYVTYDGCFYVDLNIGTEDDPNNQRLKLNAANAETLCGMTFDQIIEAANTNAATQDVAVLSEAKQYTDAAMEEATTQDIAVLHEAQAYTDEAIENIKEYVDNAGTSGGVSSWNDLTDKPFGDLGLAPIVNPGEGALWANDQPYVKASDIVLSVSDVIGSTIYYKAEGITDVLTVAAENVMECDGGITIIDRYGESLVVSVSRNDAEWYYSRGNPTMQPFYVQEPGTYFMFYEAGWTETMIFPSDIKTLDPKFIPEHNHSWSDLGEVSIYTCESTAKFIGSGNIWIDASESLVEGNIYTVVFDGVSYECVAENIGYGYLQLGNPDINNGTYSGEGEPFAIGQQIGKKTIYGILPSGDYEEHTVEILVEHKIDEKYLPDTIARVSPDPVSIDLSALDTEGKIVETFADGSTKTTTVEFDADGNPVKIIDADGNETVLAW